MFPIDVLNEKLGYEKWVLKESVLAIEKYYGIETSSTIVFHENGFKTHKIQMYEEFGSEKKRDILEKLSPLLFVTSYKIIDMIFEWLLEGNCEKVPHSFFDKIKCYETLYKESNLSYPALFKSEKELVATLFNFYKNLSKYRNKIIHGNWGIIEDGDLSFLFNYKGEKHTKTFTFKEVMNLSEVTSLIAELLTENPNDSEEIIITVKYLSDTLKDMHQGKIFNIAKPRHYKVVYETSHSQFVNLNEINQYLTSQSFGQPYTFKLVVTSSKGSSEFPWSSVKNLKSLNLNDQ